MENLILPAVVVFSVVLALLIHVVKSWLERSFLGRAGYTTKKLMTANEVDFFHRLRKALDPRWTVFPQVSMGALMDTTLKPAHPRFWDARRVFSSKICDFVVCDAKTLKPQLIIELDDRMHDFSKDRTRDTLCARAGYRTIRFWSRAKPNPTELKERLAAALILN